MSLVAVTGCSGYVGSRLQVFLDDYDRVSRVVGIDIRPPPRPGAKLGSVDPLWKLHAPLVEGPSGMLDFVRYRWTASDDITREKLGISANRPSEEVLRLMLEAKRRKPRKSPRGRPSPRS